MSEQATGALSPDELLLRTVLTRSLERELDTRPAWTEDFDPALRLSPIEPTRHRNRRSPILRWGAPLAAAALVGGVIAAVIVGGQHSQRSAPANGPTLPPLTGRPFVFQVGVAPGSSLRIKVPYLTSTHETDPVVSSDPSIGAYVISFQPGAYDLAAQMPKRTPVSFNGHQGWFGLSPEMSLVDDSPSGGATGNPTSFSTGTVAWEYAPSQWQLIQSRGAKEDLGVLSASDRDRELLVAKQLRTDLAQPLRVPYKLGYLPSGLVRGGGRATPTLEAGNPRGWSSYLSFDRAGKTALDITVNPAPPTSSASGCGFRLSIPPGPARTFACPTPSPVPVSVVRDGLSITVTGDTFSHAELQKVVDSMTFAPNINDLNTWYDATR
jgi:hypothetical protein